MKVVLFGIGLVFAAQAAIIAPGQCVGTGGGSGCAGTLTDFTGTAVGTMLASGSSTGSNVGLYAFTATQNWAVFEMGDGTLSFAYQGVNAAASLDSILRISVGGYAGWIASAGYRTDHAALGGPFVVSNQNPTAADRNLSGNTLGWRFNETLVAGVDPGEASAILWVDTNAPGYTYNNFSVIDGGTRTVSAATPAVPEPGTYALLGGGLAAVGLLRRRRQ